MSYSGNEFSSAVLAALRRDSRELAARWLDQLRRARPMEARRIFPDTTLLNHIPQMLEKMLSDPLQPEVLLAAGDVQWEIRELASLRRTQGYTASEVVDEFNLLRGIILVEAERHASEFEPRVPPEEAMRFSRSLQDVLVMLATATGRAFDSAAATDHGERAKLLSAFGRAITHELRNRVHNSLLALDVFRLKQKTGSLQPEEGDEILARLESGLRRLEGVAADVFAATVTENRPNLIAGRRQELAELVTETCSDLQPFADQRGVRVEVQGEVPTFQVDASRVQLVLVNLVNNAIKYADRRKPERYVHLRFARTTREAEWRVDVIDNGVGISSEDRESIFLRNVRLSDATEDGEGLGLALAREAIAQLGGRLWASASADGGSVFSFTLKEPDADLTVLRDSESKRSRADSS